MTSFTNQEDGNTVILQQVRQRLMKINSTIWIPKSHWFLKCLYEGRSKFMLMCFLLFQSEWTIHVYFRLLTKVQPTQVVQVRTTRNHGVHMTALINLLGGSIVHQGQVRRLNRFLVLEKIFWITEMFLDLIDHNISNVLKEASFIFYDRSKLHCLSKGRSTNTTMLCWRSYQDW